MSHNVRNHSDYLKVLAHCNAKQRKVLLENVSPKLLKCLCECCLNVLNGNVKLTSDQKRHLSRHKKVLRTLVDRKTPVKRKRQILVQKGGFLPALLGPIISTLAGLFLK
jgi:hypothetical protein